MKTSKSLVKYSALSLGVLHCINRAIESSNEKKSGKHRNGKYYHWGHGDIFYHVLGHGAPILFIHDLTVFSSTTEWSKLVPELAKTNTVYTLDLIGCGKSDKPQLTYTNFFYVQMITDFIKNVIKEETVVVATGLSGTFVLMADMLKEQLFKSIVLINPPSFSSLQTPPDGRSRMRMKLMNDPIIGKSYYYMAVNKERTEDALMEHLFYNPFSVEYSVVHASYEASHLGNGSARFLYASKKGHYLNIDTTKALQETDTRLAILFGDHETHGVEKLDAYRKRNANIEFYRISESKRLPQLENPQEVLDCLKNILND